VEGADIKQIFMQKMTLKIFTFTFILLTVASCSNFGGKTSYISSFERFVEKVSDNQATYTDEDWEQADARFEQFADTDYQKYSRKLTKEEKQKIGKLKGKYLAIRTKTEVGSFMDDLQNVIDELGGVVEGFTEEITKESNNQQNNE